MTALTILLRVGLLGAAMALLGQLAFALLVARPAFLSARSDHGPALLALERRLGQWGAWSLAGFVLCSMLGLLAQVAVVTNRGWFDVLSLQGLGPLLSTTQYGHVWLARLLCAVLLAGVFLVRRCQRQGQESRRLQGTTAILAGVMLVMQSWASHAAAAEGGTLVVQVASDMLHLLAAGVWFGGLPWLVALIRWGHQSDHAEAASIVARATQRFSSLALGGVGLLLLTGVATAWNLVGSVPALIGTPYGQVLLGKIGVLLLLLILAAVNHWFEVPRLARAVAAQQPRQIRATLGRLRRNVLGELYAGMVILVLVGALGTLPPARHVSPVWPLPFRLDWEVTWVRPDVPVTVIAGSLIAVVGLLALGCAVKLRSIRWPATGGGAMGLLAGIWMVLQALALDAYPTTYLRPAVPYQALSIANGLRLYQENCTSCHGTAGYGDGPAAAGLKPPPADLTARHSKDHTVGDFFWWLSYGIQDSAMPGFGDRISEEERWDLINFLRTLSAAEQARPLGALVEEEPWLIAPDFSYTTTTNVSQTLKDQRGENLVLLVLFRLPGSAERLMQLQELTPRLQQLRTTVLAVPLHTGPMPAQEVAAFPALPVVVDGAAEASVTYAMFRKSLSPTGGLPIPPVPVHLEFLIDRQGYIRGRWLADGGPKWAESMELLAAIAWLNQEKPRAPAPDDHIH